MKNKACLSAFTLSLVVLVLIYATRTSAQEQVAQPATASSVPKLIRYGGVLKDADGAVLTSQTVGITFALYNHQDGGVALWTETRNVITDVAGQYNVMLGSTKSEGVPAELFADQEQRWLAVQIQGQPEPARVLLVSVPYAFKALEAETLGGLPASAFVKAEPSSSSGAGTTVSAVSAAANEKASGTAGPAKPPGGLGFVRNFLCPTAGNPAPLFIPIFVTSPGAGPANTICNSAILQNIIGPAANVGIGVTPSAGASPVPKLDVAGDINTANSRSSYQIGKKTVLSVFGSQNVFIGEGAGASNTGITNTFVGSLAGFNNAAGSNDTFVGAEAGISNQGNNNTFVGHDAGIGNIGGAYNTFNGAGAGGAHETGDGNSFYGYNTAYDNYSGSNNAFFGAGAGSENDGSYNTFVGSSAGALNLGSGNVFSGYQAGLGNETNAGNNTFSGYQAGFNNTASNGSFYGYQAGYANTADGNSFFGFSAGKGNTSGNSNTFVGYSAGTANTTGEGNTFLGANAGSASDTIKNTFLGYSAGSQTINGYRNTAVGYNAGRSNVGGIFNTCFGDNACLSEVGGVVQPTNGSENTCLGTGACSSTNVSFSGSENICVGMAACNNESSPNNNIEIGNFGPAIETPGSNQILIGEPAVQTDTYIAGVYNALAGTAGPFQSVCVDRNGKVWGNPGPTDCDGTPHHIQATVVAPLQDEVQTLQFKVKALQQEIESLKAQLPLQNAAFQERLSRLESLVTTQVQTAAGKDTQPTPPANGGLQ